MYFFNYILPLSFLFGNLIQIVKTDCTIKGVTCENCSENCKNNDYDVGVCGPVGHFIPICFCCTTDKIETNNPQTTTQNTKICVFKKNRCSNCDQFCKNNGFGKGQCQYYRHLPIWNSCECCY